MWFNQNDVVPDLCELAGAAIAHQHLTGPELSEVNVDGLAPKREKSEDAHSYFVLFAIAPMFGKTPRLA